MKIHNLEKFFTGFLILVFAYIPFSFLDQAEKYKIENCYFINGTVEKVNQAKGGITIELKEVEYKIRVVGEFYNAVNKYNLSRFLKPNNKLKIYLLKSEYLDFFKMFNSSLGFKDAVIIQSANNKILTIEKIKERLVYTYYINLIISFIACITGFSLITLSFRNN